MIQKQLSSPREVWLLKYKNGWLYDVETNTLCVVEDFLSVPKGCKASCYKFDDAWAVAKKMGRSGLMVRFLDDTVLTYDFS